MALKNVQDVSCGNLQALIDTAVLEGSTIDYKQALPGGGSDSKKEFLADVSSFANADGGFLIYGMKEARGVPTEICGVAATDTDAEILRLENLLRDGLSPRINAAIRPLVCEAKTVVIIQIFKSWNAPHRVVFAGHDKFYSRNSAGKFAMDVQQLRTAFVGGQSVFKDIDDFLQQRNIEICQDTSFLPLGSDAKMILYLIPMQSFAEGRRLDLNQIRIEELPPLIERGWNDLINLEGLLTYFPIADGKIGAYTQLYRNGMIEAAASSALFARGQVIPGKVFESYILQALPRYVGVAKKLAIEPPVAVAIALAGIRGYHFAGDPMRITISPQQPLKRDILKLPAQVVNDLEVPPHTIMRPLFDLVWNAFGFRQSHSYNSKGEWS